MRASNDKEQVIYAATLPASGLDRHSFALRHPLVDVKEGLVAKFEDDKSLNSDVCDYLLRQVILEMQDAARCYSLEAGGDVLTKELNYRPVVCSMLLVFTRLAPRAGELLDGEDPKQAAQKEVMAGFQQAVVDVEMKPPDDGVESSSTISEGSDLSGWSFCNACFVHEDGTSLKPHEEVDCRQYITALDLLGKPSLPRSLFEFKAQNMWSVYLYQVLYHACGAAMQNVKAGRFKKVYVVTLGIGWVGVAEIDPIAALQVSAKNQISVQALNRFQRQIAGKREYLKKKGKDEEAAALASRFLEKPVAQLRESLIATMTNVMGAAAANLNTTVKLGTLFQPVFNKTADVLLGSATYRLLTYSTLHFPLVRGMKATEDDRRVVSGIARVIYGDRALRWTLPAVEALASKRQQERLAQANAVLPPR